MPPLLRAPPHHLLQPLRHPRGRRRGRDPHSLCTRSRTGAWALPRQQSWTVSRAEQTPVGRLSPLTQILTPPSVSCFVFPAVVGQAKLLPPERMKHSIKLVDDQMNWCDSAIEVQGGFLLLELPQVPHPRLLRPYLQPLVGSTRPDSFQASAAMGEWIQKLSPARAEFQ